MSKAATPVGAEVPTGNTFDKYGSQNPVVKHLMAGFEHEMEGILHDDRLAEVSA